MSGISVILAVSVKRNQVTQHHQLLTDRLRIVFAQLAFLTGTLRRSIEFSWSLLSANLCQTVKVAGSSDLPDFVLS